MSDHGLGPMMTQCPQCERWLGPRSFARGDMLCRRCERAQQAEESAAKRLRATTSRIEEARQRGKTGQSPSKRSQT